MNANFQRPDPDGEPRPTSPQPAARMRRTQETPRSLDDTTTEEIGRTERMPLPQPPSAFPRAVEEETPAPPRRRGGGCLPALLGIGGIVLPLVILALFLPPFSLWEDIDNALNDSGDKSQTTTEGELVTLRAESPRLDAEGLSIEAADLSGPFSVSVRSLTPADYIAAATPAEGWSCATDIPARHALVSRVYSLAQSGTAPGYLSLTVARMAENGTEAGPLALYTWNATPGAWEFLPSALGTEPDTLIAQMTYLPRCVAMFRLPDSARAAGVTLSVQDTTTLPPDLLTTNVRVYPAGLRPVATGALQGVLPPGSEASQGAVVLPLIQNFDNPSVVDVATVRTILENPAVRMEHARQIAAFALREGSNYAGVVIDYRDLSPDLRDPYTAFIHDLSDVLHDNGLLLTVVLPTDAASRDSYDWAAIGHYADEVALTAPLNPAAYASGGEIDEVLTWATGQISPSKLLLSLSALSVEDQGGELVVPATLETALGYLGTVSLTPADSVPAGETVTAQRVDLPGVTTDMGQDDTAQTPFIRYQSGSTQRTMWITDPAALRYRMDVAAAHNLNGVIVRDLFTPGTLPDLSSTVIGFRLDQPASTETFDLALEWIVRAGDSVIEQQSGTLDEPFTVQTQPDQTELIIEAQVNGVLLDSQTIQVISAAEPPPAEATPEPAPAEEPAASEPAAEGVASGLIPDFALPAPVVPAGSSGFEAGGAIREMAGPPVLAAGRTHLVWLRLEVPYQLGQQPQDQERVIGEIQANGLKVFISVTGDVNELAATDRAEYINQYAAYVGGLAALGADGIELWNNMNHVSVWPTNQIDPAEYVQLLALSYNAIKTANPNTLVSTGGLAPTDGAGESGQSAEMWNDDVYWQGLAQAGAAQYADCIGIRYLRGATAPDATSGDPRGDSPVYYVPQVIDRAWNAFNGALPVCFTRFGYLSAEGYGALPDNQSWAQSITTALQAQWLADAIRIDAERTDGKVRLLLIWGLDAPVADSTNPNAGYGIIRPDGSCPACDAITPVLEK